ncbi:MAG: hypothetical protein LBH40_03280 [Alphaproteobacteria bacterium]|jgi:hypothetical protein|nr:hypothetical protein [Alphaproteobacteria bacterium]
MVNNQYPKDLLTVASKVIWFQKSQEALEDKTHFLNYLMTYGSEEDIKIAYKYYSKKDFKEALQKAIPGIFDEKSWNYWHIILDITPTPPLPRRDFLTEEEYNSIPKWKAKRG